MFFDTHAHYDDKAFDADREAALAEIHKTVSAVIDPGCDIPSSKKAQELAGQHDFMYFAAGIHPEELSNIPENYPEILAALAKDKKCVAIGEIGLDYYWDASQKDLQKKLFETQLALALELDLPVIIHDREAHGDCMEIVRKYDSIRGVFHCYSGSAEMAEELLKRGWYLGFDGPVTYKNARKALEVLAITPLDRILLETDSPYLSPAPLRGTRNNSANLQYVAAKIAEAKGCTAEEIAALTAENACRLFEVRL